MTRRAMMNRMTATATTAPARIATRLRGARIDHGAVSEPLRPFANARHWAVLADGSRSGFGLPRLYRPGPGRERLYGVFRECRAGLLGLPALLGGRMSALL